MSPLVKRTLVGLAVVALPLTASAEAVKDEKLETMLTKAGELTAAGQYPQALTELSWASDHLRKLHLKKLEGFFPETVAGFTAGEVKSNNALGMVNMERIYTDGSGTKMKVTLTGAAAAKGAASQGMGALAGLAQMAAMMDGNPNTERVRIQGSRTATVANQRGKLKMTMGLTGGNVLQVEPTGGSKPTKENMVAVVEGFKFKEMDAYLEQN